MPLVEFTPNLSSQTEAPACRVEGTTVAEVLAAVFARHPKLRGYLFDDQGALRPHVVVFVDGGTVRDRRTLSDPVSPASEIFVMQALSGG